jgi:hypothetical protein
VEQLYPLGHWKGFIKAKFLMLPLGGLLEKYAVTWNFGTNSVFALEPRKTTKSLYKVGRSQDFPDAN